jgi:hypothetical protein
MKEIKYLFSFILGGALVSLWWIAVLINIQAMWFCAILATSTLLLWAINYLADHWNDQVLPPRPTGES